MEDEKDMCFLELVVPFYTDFRALLRVVHVKELFFRTPTLEVYPKSIS